MKRPLFIKVIILLIPLSILSGTFQGFGQSPVPRPEEHFGFIPGSDRNLINYETLIDYLMKLDKASPMLRLVEIGKSPMGKKMYVAFISSEKNINNLDKLREINRKLALDPNLSSARQKEYINEGKVFFLATLSMHSNEVAPSQAAPLIAYKLVTAEDPAVRKYLDDVVYMMVPNHNPDGMDMVVENYYKYKGTQYEGAFLPGIYHKYAGHDNNRDFVTLTQEDTKAIARIYNLDWFPQVMIEKHQMGPSGIRYYVPPAHDPISENIDPELWTWTGIFGTNMLHDLTNAGLSGVGQKTIFDMYWPGSTETCLWKNVIAMLTEAASVQLATPVYVEPTELQASGKGLSEYAKSTNFPLPWPGGWWHLSDIVKLEIESTFSIIKTSSLNKNDILKFRNDLCRREVEKGLSQPPYYYVVPGEQADQSELIRLVELMKEQGISTFQLAGDYALTGINFKPGDIVFPLAQPFREFIKEVMEKQTYPVRHYSPGGAVIRPYDVTNWSLPLQMGLTSYEIKVRDITFESALKPIEGIYSPLKKSYKLPALFPVTSNGSFKAAFAAMQNGLKVSRTTKETVINGRKYDKGSFILQGNDESLLNKIVKESCTEPGFVQYPDKLEFSAIRMPRIALVETYLSDADAGWTRYIFDTYHIPYTVLHPDDFEKADLTGSYDVVVIPGTDKAILMNGKPSAEGGAVMSNYHPDYQKGMGKKGFENLLLFINNGGKVVSWGQSANLFTGVLEFTKGEAREEFVLPFTNVADQASKEGLFVPGSWLRIVLKPDHPLTWGMPSETGVAYRGAALFSTSIPKSDMDRRVIGVFPEDNLLISGYAEKEEKMANKPGMIWLKKGKGQIILYAFNPQFRASTQATYKLLFNALLPFSVEE